MKRRVRYIVALLGIMLLVSACGGGGASTVVGGEGGSKQAGDLPTLQVGAVPAVNTMVLYVARDKGFFREAGVTVELSLADAGPAIINATVEGSYDVSNASAFPMLLAMAQGAPIQAVVGMTPVGPHQGNSGVIVRPDSGINSYDDLTGKTIATNALTSLTALAIKAAIEANGGDPESIEIVPLPFSQAVQAVDRGEVAAAVVLQPFVTQAVQSGLKNIGDPIGHYIPKNSPYGLMFTTQQTYEQKRKAMEAFTRGLKRGLEYVDAHPEALTQAAVKYLDMPKSLVQQLPDSRFTPKLPKQPLKELVDMMVEYGYLESADAVNLSSFLPGSS